MVHAQLATASQLERMAKVGMMPSFFVAHVWHWGDVHIRNFGPARAAQISQAGTARRLGLPFTFHQDAPVIPPDMLETVWCAAVRRTRAGVVLGEDQRIPVLDALRAVTANAAYQYFEEADKGTLEAGKRADLVQLSADPLSVPPDELKAIRVLRTVKDGEDIFNIVD